VNRTTIACVTSLVLVLGLSACTNPYDPAQRFVGGGLLGAGAGAAIGAAAGGGPGAALGAAIGGATGAVGGLATTPRHLTATITDTQAITAIPDITVTTAIPVITVIMVIRA